MQWLCVLLVLMPVHSVNSEFSEPQNITRSPCTDSNHLFLAPGVLTAGGTNRACVSRFYPEGPARMVLKLLSEDQPATVSRELPPGDGGCIDIAVPQKPNSKAKLVVNLWYPDAKCSWEREVSVLISAGRLVVVHTERARYRPGETLRARVIALKPDLTPAHGQIDEIWVEGPRGAWDGTRVVQWLRARTRMGIAQVQHELDELAPAGRWTIRARLADGSQGSAVFLVGNYELPPFQLSVRHAPRVLRTSERLVWTVCVRYPWTEAVEGMLVIRIRGAGGTTVAQEASSSIKTVVRIKAPRACHRHAAAARRVGLNGTNPPDVVVADFSFQEDGTRIWQNTTVVSHVVDKPVTLEFLRKLRAVISPGLPYKLKVKATRWDDKPAADELVRVCRSGTELPGSLPHAPAANGTCQDAVTDDRGIARVTFTASADGSSYYSFQASLQNDSSVSASPLHLAARRASLHASLGPIKPDANSARTFVPLYINLRNISRPLTVHFVVITRGGIIYRWGATTQCPLTSSSDYIPTTSRDTQCFHYDSSAANYQTNESRGQNNAANYQSNTANYHPNKDNYQSNTANYHPNRDNYQSNTANYHPNKDNYQSNTANYHPNSDNYQNTTSYQTDTAKLEAVDPDSLLDRHLLRVMLPIKVTHQMCPDSHLVAYFYYNGEFVSASKQFEMEECFSNKVEATWLSRQVAPGSMASLRVTTPGPALCALSVLDSASKWNQPAPTLKELVMTSLRRLMDSHRNLTEYEADGACYKESGDIPDLPTNSLELTSTWLAAAGVRVAGGDAPQTRRCSSPPAPLMDDATVPRSDFSEAWLWRLTAVGSNGSSTVSARAPDSISRFEAGAVCLARTGISVSQPAVLQVFREFFIHADGPRRLRRGDSAIFRYRLFNYLYEPLSVQIQILTDEHLSGPAELVESACVPARASVARRAELRARADGRARLAIRAKSVSAPGCGNTTSRTTVSDEVIIPITVDPEGVPVQEHKSILLCGRGSLESGRSDVSWSWPPIQPVPGTEALTVWAMGDIKGPLLFDADGLVQLPRGCGEQNMARLAANLLALQQLPPHSPAAATAREHVARGFTRQLQYAHPAGGFSAFGAKDAAPSTWLTAFALKHMRRAHQVLNPELPIPPALDRAERWLLSQQMENGCFRNEGQVFHRELRGGLNEEGEIASVALTAYVITALADSGASVRARVVRDALSCLRALPRAAAREPARVYAHALLAYAFMRLRAYEDDMRKSNEASLLWDKKEAVGAGLKDDEELRELMELLQLARRSQDYVWWETSSLATSVEATAYALLALSYCPAALRGSRCAPDARAAVRWLSAHRNHAGGFQSTQDTLVALEALSSWSSAQPSAPPALTVRVVSDGELKKTFISPDVKVPEIIRLTGKSKLDVSVEGTGCALIQATRSYNTLASDQSKDKSLTVQATVHTDGAFDCDSNGTNCFCAAVIEVCVAWAGRFPEMCVVEAWLPPAFGADAARLYRLLQPTDALLRRIELSPNGGRATLYLAGGADVTDGGHRCFPLHAVGPRARSKPAHVRVTDYYAPTTNHTQMYTIPEDCPPRITEPTNEYLRSHNLFEKARSVTDSGEVLITHEYSFEDIPEGIPFEDPLYDFNREDIAYLSKHNEANKEVEDLQHNKLANSYNNHINDFSKTKINEDVKTNSQIKAQPKTNYYNAIEAANEERKRSSSSAKRGHSMPFYTDYSNFNIANLRAYYEHDNGFFRPNFDHRPLNYPQQFYEYNPYIQRSDTNLNINHYQATNVRHDRIDNNNNKGSFIRPDNHHKDHRTRNHEESPTVSHGKSEFHNPMTITPLLSEKGYTTTTSTYPTPRTDFESFGEPDKSQEQNSNQFPVYSTEKPEPSIQTDNASFFSGKISSDLPIKSSDTQSNNNPEKSNAQMAPASTFDPNLIGGHFPSSNHQSNTVQGTGLNYSQSTDNPSFSNHQLTGLAMPDEGSQIINAPFDPTLTSNIPTRDSALANTFFKPNIEPGNNSFKVNNHGANNFKPSQSNYIPGTPNIHGNNASLDYPASYNTSPSNGNPALSDNKDLVIKPNKDPERASGQFETPNLSNINADRFFTPNLPIDHNTGDNKGPNKEAERISANFVYQSPANFNPSVSNYNSPLTSLNFMGGNQDSQAAAVDNPKLSSFHVIDTDGDLDVPTGMEGPVPAIALPPHNYVAVAPPPGFQPQFHANGYPRLYPPLRPQLYYRHTSASVF